MSVIRAVLNVKLSILRCVTIPYMRVNDYQTDRPPALGPFLLVSVLLHGILLIGYHMLRSPMATPPAASILSIRLSPMSATPQLAGPKDSQSKPSARTSEQHKYDPPEGKKSDPDAWQQGMEGLQKLMQQPGFFDKFREKDSSIPNYRPDLFGSEERVTELTIDTYRRLATGEMDIVFRYPSGKKICVRAREPNPMDPFDFGSWEVLVAGCH
jgi:hypothetical protein